MQSIFSRIFSFFLALQLLNCSVDAPDALNFHAPEDLTYNEQESVVEILIEKVFGFGNVIAEYDDGDSDETSVKKLFSIDFFVLPDSPETKIALLCELRQRNYSYPDFYPETLNDSFSPPPEV